MKYLNDKCIPYTYNIYLNLDLNSNTYNGSNSIELDIQSETNNIQFHGLDYKIKKMRLDNEYLDIENLIFDTENDIYTYGFDYNLDIGKYVLSIEFESKYTNSTGLVKYINTQENDRTLYFTRFEPNFARKCFPCWDEPKYKVKYNMSIEINDSSYIAIFNTDPYEIVKINDTNTRYTYYETIPMSTYVSSFIIGKFSYIEAYTKNKIRTRIYMPTDLTNSERIGKFALECAVRMMDFISDYYNAPYPFNKLDFIPIDNVDAKGMENYGLIFIDAPFLLYDKKTSTIDHKIGIANVIAHEIVHQWFGNLVTMIKWDELWLKESFAKFFEYYIVDNVFPEWDIRSFYINNIFRTQEVDSLSLKSVKTTVKHNKHIMQIYDEITYFKGASILFMVMDFLGVDKFRNSISSYLNKYKFSTTNSNYFIDSLIETLDHDSKTIVKSIINTYIYNKGIPIIKLENRSISIDEFNTRKIIYNDIKSKLSKKSDSNNKWTIPLKTNNNKYLVLKENEPKHLLNDVLPITNNKFLSYYRICYDEEHFAYIVDNIPKTDSHQHMSILNDLYILALYNICPISNWLIYLDKLINHLLSINDIEKFNYYLLNQIYSSVANIRKTFSEPLIQKLFNEDFISITKEVYYKRLYKLNKKLVNHLNKIFNIFNINTVLRCDFSSDNINYNRIIIFLLDKNKTITFDIIKYLFKNKMYNVSGDLNKIIAKHIIKTNDNILISELLDDKNKHIHIANIIDEALNYSNSKDIGNNLFRRCIETSCSHNHIIKLLNQNKIFGTLFTDYFINNYDDYIKQFPLDSKIFGYILKHLILIQNDPDLIRSLFDKLNNTSNDKFILKLNQSKNILFNRLYSKINMLKLLNKLV